MQSWCSRCCSTRACRRNWPTRAHALQLATITAQAKDAEAALDKAVEDEHATVAETQKAADELQAAERAASLLKVRQRACGPHQRLAPLCRSGTASHARMHH